MQTGLTSIKEHYSLPFGLSMLLHITLLAFFIIGITLSPKTHPYSPHSSTTKIVQAVTVNQQQVNAEIKKLEQQQHDKTKAQQKNLAKLEAQAHSAKQARQQEEAKLARMRKEQAKLQQAQQTQRVEEKAQQQRLAKLKAQQQSAEKNLTNLSQATKRMTQTKAQETVALAKLEEAQKAAKARQLAWQKQQAAHDLLHQQLQTERQQLNASRSKYMQSLLTKYQALILNAIRQNWIVPLGVSKNLHTELLISLAPGGTVLSVQIAKSSGNSALDNSAITAVYKSSPLPVPTDDNLFDEFKQFELTVWPRQ